MVVLSGAFFGEALLFYFHLSSQSGMLAEIHLLLVYSILFCAVSTAAEAVGGGSVAALARAFFTLLQGSWFVQITHTVYGRVPWPQDMATESACPRQKLLFGVLTLAWLVITSDSARHFLHAHNHLGRSFCGRQHSVQAFLHHWNCTRRAQGRGRRYLNIFLIPLWLKYDTRTRQIGGSCRNTHMQLCRLARLGSFTLNIASFDFI